MKAKKNISNKKDAEGAQLFIWQKSFL